MKTRLSPAGCVVPYDNPIIKVAPFSNFRQNCMNYIKPKHQSTLRWCRYVTVDLAKAEFFVQNHHRWGYSYVLGARLQVTEAASSIKYLCISPSALPESSQPMTVLKTWQTPAPKSVNKKIKVGISTHSSTSSLLNYKKLKTHCMHIKA